MGARGCYFDVAGAVLPNQLPGTGASPNCRYEQASLRDRLAVDAVCSGALEDTDLFDDETKKAIFEGKAWKKYRVIKQCYMCILCIITTTGLLVILPSFLRLRVDIRIADLYNTLYTLTFRNQTPSPP